MESKRIAVLGDPMLDVWTDLRTVRANPDDPTVPVVVFEGTQTKPGGALNVAANLAAFGHQVTFFDVISRHPTDNERLAVMLVEVGIAYRGFRDLTLGTPVTRKERVRLDGRLLYRKDNDCRPLVVPPLKLLNRLPPVFDAFVFVDYGKGSLYPGEIVPALITTMPDNVLLVLDAKPDLHRAFLGWRKCWRPNVVLKANASEAERVFGGTAPSSWMFRTEYQVKMAVVTTGERGATVADRKGAQTPVPPTAMLAAYPTICGAGDVFTAALTDALLRGQNEAEATQSAVNAATGMTSSGQTETLCLAREDAFFTDPDLVAG